MIVSLWKNEKYIVYIRVIFQPKYKGILYYDRQCSKVSLTKRKKEESKTKNTGGNRKGGNGPESQGGSARQFDLGKAG